MGEPKRKHEEETAFEDLPPITLDGEGAPSAEHGHEPALHDLPPIEYAGEEQAPGPPPAREQPWYDQALSFLHGASGHIGDEAAALVSKLDPRNKDLSYDELARSYATQGDQARAAHPVYHGAGQALLGAGAAGLAGPGIAAQAAAGAGVGALSNYGDTHDAGSAAVSGGIGAGMGALGGVAGKVIGKAFGRAAPVVDDATTVVDDAAMRAAMKAHAARPPDPNMLRAVAPPPVVPGRAPLPGAMPYASGIDTADVPTQALGGLPAPTAMPGPAPVAAPAPAADVPWYKQALQAALGYGQRLPGARPAMAIARGMDGAAAHFAGRSTNETAQGATIGSLAALRGIMSPAQAPKLSANQGVVNWAVQSVLGNSDAHGIAPTDAQSLNRALQSGNPQDLASALYVAGQKDPKLAAAMAEAYRRANAQESTR